MRIHLLFGGDGRLAQRQLVQMPKKEILYRETIAADGVVRLLDAKGKELSVRKATLRRMRGGLYAFRMAPVVTSHIDEHATSDLVRALLDDDADADAETVTLLRERSGGNPFFIEELVAFMQESGDTTRGLEVPATLHGLLAASPAFWLIHPAGFRAPRVMELARLQCWTLKPAAAGER